LAKLKDFGDFEIKSFTLFKIFFPKVRQWERLERMNDLQL